MSVISVDYDDTYTKDPEMFDAFIAVMKSRGHIPVVVTFRNKDRYPITDPPKCEVFYTDGVGKAEFMRGIGFEVDIWIDDWPELIGKTRP